MSTVYNNKINQYLAQPQFLGDNLGLARYDELSYPIFQKNTDKQRSFFWLPNVINLSQDKIDFKQKLNEAQKFIFTSNLKSQILLDSIQARGVLTTLLPYVSIPELEASIIWWGAFEQIHSESYTHIIRNVYSNPDSVFNTINEIEPIFHRTNEIVKYYDSFTEYAKWYSLLGYGTHIINGNTLVISELELKKKLWLLLNCIYALEGIRFFVSFACNFALDKVGLMRGSAKILQQIARDEFQHLAITKNIIKHYQKSSDPLIKQIIRDTQQECVALLTVVVEQEKNWATYLFQHGAMLGLNEQILHQYGHYIGNDRGNEIGLPNLFEVTKNPIPWMRDYLEQDRIQRAPQEEDITSYRIGAVNNDIKDEDTFDF